MRKILFLVLLFGLQTAGAQRVEQLIGLFDRQADAATANRFFSALREEGFLDEDVVFGSQTPADSMRQQVWYWAAEWLYDRQDYERAATYARMALPLFSETNDERADCLNLLGIIHIRLGDFLQAAGYAKQCLEIDLRSGDDDRIASSMNTVAGIYMAGGQAQEAEQYVLGALEHIGRVDNPARHAVILGTASEVCHALGRDQQSLAYAEEAYRIDSLLGRQPQMAIRQSQRASALLGLHRYQEAEAVYRQVIPALQATGDVHSAAIALNRLGMALLCQERPREAIPYYKEAATLFSQMGDLYNELHAHRGLYESYWTLSPDSAKAELDCFNALKDSLYTHATADALSRYNAEFGNDQLLMENAAMRQAHRLTVVVGLVVLLLVVAGMWLLVRRVRNREKKRIEALMQEVEALRNDSREPDKGQAKSPDGGHAPASAELQDDRSRLTASDEDRLFLVRVVEVVNEGLAQRQWSVETVAAKLNMSVQTFRRRLMSATGETPKAFISAIQMEKASKLLLKNPDIPVVQVAKLCGFDEASSFTHTFKRIYGVSPSQYRENARKD